MKTCSLKIIPFLAGAALLSACIKTSDTRSFRSYWDLLPDRYWIGPEFWANRLQDWQLKNGRLECINPVLPKRTLHLLSHQLSDRPGSLEMQVTTGSLRKPAGAVKDVYSGFLIGAGTAEMDFRRRALIHGAYGKGGGTILAVDSRGRIVLIDNESGREWYSEPPEREPGDVIPSSFLLSLNLMPRGEQYELSLTSLDPETREEIIRLDTLIECEGHFGGGLALVCNGGSYWFSGWKMKGSKLRADEQHVFGPVMGVQYTLSEKTLRLTAQMPPLSESDEPTVELQVRDRSSNKWSTAASSQITTPGYLAEFRIADWADEMEHEFRILYHLTGKDGKRIPHYYRGLVLGNPVERDEVVAAAFTGNSNSHGSISGERFDFTDILWFPHEDMTSKVLVHRPDMLIFTGDNVYEGRPTPPDLSNEENTALDYLYKWFMFLWAHGEMTRKIPAVTIPDDHDVYHGNIWGSSGKKAPPRPRGGIYPEHYRGHENYWQQDQGGYKLSPGLVNMIQNTQTSHLPEPIDPDPVKQGIEVYFCNMNYGRISWAILEDRKFKSAPARIHPNIKILNGFPLEKNIDGSRLDSPRAALLGERQLSFLREWSADWEKSDMKVAISQSLFANLASYPDTFVTDAHTPGLPVLPQGKSPSGYRKAKDMDSNGWPQSGRNRALHELRKGFALMIGGDRHLGSVIHHGIDQWEDAGFSFCVPSIANLWPRRWFPPSQGESHRTGLLPHTGRYYDGFGNKMTVHAVSNPYITGHQPSLLHDRAPGYGIIRLNRKTQMITLECWPRHCDPEAYNAEQYPGWPVSFPMEDNYGREPDAWLPLIIAEGLERPPVIQVINEITGEIIYTRRLASSSFQPGVFEKGTYTVRIGEPGTAEMKNISGLVATETPDREHLNIIFQ
jgi:hypothetical protein